MIYSAYKLNKQGDNTQPWFSFSFLIFHSLAYSEFILIYGIKFGSNVLLFQQELFKGYLIFSSLMKCHETHLIELVVVHEVCPSVCPRLWTLSETLSSHVTFQVIVIADTYLLKTKWSMPVLGPTYLKLAFWSMWYLPAAQSQSVFVRLFISTGFWVC